MSGVLAEFRSLRSVQSRSVVSLVFDVPLDNAPAALEALGGPTTGETVWVAFTKVGESEALPPAYHGTFEGYRMIQDREALAITVELPLERGHLVLRALGVPTPRSRIPVVLARLHEGPALERNRQASSKTPGAQAVQRCALRVKDEPFQRFLLGHEFVAGDPSGNEQEAIAAVRARLQVQSRAELAQNHEKLRAWWDLENEFEAWLQGDTETGEN